MEIKGKVNIHKSVYISLTGKDIIELLQKSGRDIPSTAEVHFRVPMGGDWSGMDVDVDNVNHLTIAYQEVKNEDCNF